MSEIPTSTTPQLPHTSPGKLHGRLLYSPFREIADPDKQIDLDSLEHAEPSYDADERTIIRILGPDHTTFLADEDAIDIHVMGQAPETEEPRLEKVSKYLGPGVIAMLTVIVPVEGHLPPHDLSFDSLANGLHMHGSLQQMPSLFIAKSSDRNGKDDLQIYLNGVKRNPALREYPYAKLLDIRPHTLLIGDKDFFMNDDQAPGVAVLPPPNDRPGLRIGAITYDTEANQVKVEPFSDDLRTVMTKMMPAIMRNEISIAGWITRGPHGLYISGKNLYLPATDSQPFPCIVLDTYNKAIPTDVLDERAATLRQVLASNPADFPEELSAKATSVPHKRDFGSMIRHNSTSPHDLAIPSPPPKAPARSRPAELAPAHAPPKKPWKIWGK